MATLITRNVTKLSLQQLSLGIEKLNECTKAYIILEKEKKRMEKHDEQLIFFQLFSPSFLWIGFDLKYDGF